MHIIDKVARITNNGWVPSLRDNLIVLDSYFSIKRIVLVIQKTVCSSLLLNLAPSIVILRLSCDVMQYFRVIICVGKPIVVLACENLHISRIFRLPFLIRQV